MYTFIKILGADGETNVFLSVVDHRRLIIVESGSARLVSDRQGEV